MEDNGKVQGRTFTSNHVKLLKHMDKLEIIQNGGRPSPVMIHMLPYNPCNLTCSFCCYANRAVKGGLTLDQMKKALDSFRYLGATGLEMSGAGEPTLHPDFDAAITHAYELGYKIGVCTNGKDLERVKTWDKFSWVRIGMYGFTEGYSYNLSVFDGLPIVISGAYVWDANIKTSDNPNITGQWKNSKGKKLSKKFQTTEDFYKMIEWVEANKIPTRIAFNAIKPAEEVQKDIETIRGLIDGMDLKYAFLSDFNYKSVRKNHNCYMHMVKPTIYSDGNVYVCPSSCLSTDNKYGFNEEFKLCDIDGIIDFYEKGVTTRNHACTFCKYAIQNELIDDILTPTQHNDFA